jgi:hypothetical protein
MLYFLFFILSIPCFANDHHSDYTQLNQDIINKLDRMTFDSNSNFDNDFDPLPALVPSIKAKQDSIDDQIYKMESIQSFDNELPQFVDRLPIGIKKNIGNIDYTLMLTNLMISPEGAKMSVYLRLLYRGKKIYFGAENVPLNSDGAMADIKLVMLGILEIPCGAYRLVLKGNNFNSSVGLANNAITYATVGCQGLKDIQLCGEIEFSRNVIKKVNSSTSQLESEGNQVVKSPFTFYSRTWEDMIIDVSLPSFEVNGLHGFIFRANHIVFDFSETKAAQGIHFPKKYQDKYYYNSSSLWTGFYIDSLEVMLPEQFSKRSDQVRPTCKIYQFIIDRQGVSGGFTIQKEILPLNEGSASGWKFSVTTLLIEFEANVLIKGGFGGQLLLPISTKNSNDCLLNYTAIINSDGEIFLTVGLTQELSLDFLMARLILKPNSYVVFSLVNKVKEGQANKVSKAFQVEAVLNGNMKISASNSSSGGALNADGLTFTELRIMSFAPYFKLKELKYEGTISFSNFPVSISKISIGERLVDAKQCVVLEFNLAVCLAQNKFKGNTTIGLCSYYNVDQSNETGCWKFYKVKISQIAIAAEFSGLKVSGLILFIEDDDIYGNAFYGQVAITYANKFSITSSALFGAKDFRYWYVDARIDLPTAITVVGPFMLNGFGGGAYSKMSKAPRGSRLPYVPDESASFGVKALVAYVVAKKEVCKGDLMFEMNFNSHGGIKYIAFYGNAEIVAGAGAMGGMLNKLNSLNDGVGSATNASTSNQIENGNIQSVASTTDLGSRPASNIFAYIGIQYNFETATLEANSELYINLGVLRGRGPGNRAGWMQLHISPEKWYCYAGTPEDRVGVVLSLAGLQIQTGSYFMVGSQMPRFPAPPERVLRILGPEVYDSKSNISESSLQSGAGFAFGLDFGLSADINFMILYAHLNAGVGGDVMLRQYPNAHCEGSSSALGINNWYANGRVYTYLEGEIGVKVDLMFIHTHIPIISGSAAAMLEGGGPNPTWAKGYLRVKFDVLGGKISGDMNLKLSLGDDCVIVSNSNAPISYKVISDISPSHESNEVDVFVSPQVAFNLSVGNSVEIEQNGQKKLFRVKLNQINLMEGNNNLLFEQVWSNKNQTLTLNPFNTLPSKKEITIKVKVQFETFNGTNWETYVFNGAVPEEEQVVTFTTSLAPDYIPEKNILYMYPIIQQQYVYPNQTNKGYIILKKWQNYLFENDTKYANCIQIKTESNSRELPFDVIVSDKKISYTIPPINTNTKYCIELVRKLKLNLNPNKSEVNQYDIKEAGSYSVENNNANEIVKNEGNHSLLKFDFKTSSFQSFSEKMNAISKKSKFPIYYLDHRDWSNMYINNVEAFDSIELFGSPFSNSKPLLSATSLLNDDYYMNRIYPIVYKLHTDQSLNLQRDTSIYGYPPSKAFCFDIDYIYDKNRLPYINTMIEVYKSDFHGIENYVFKKFLQGDISVKNNFSYYFNFRFPEPNQGLVMPIHFKYTLPGDLLLDKFIINYIR